mmetsp:Transcript_8251/g.10473  ORF Transcript_8251/g.10473 Transcript_8251/m.10473 type:complete len:101 (-) Transcript_8251:325-627(-)
MYISELQTRIDALMLEKNLRLGNKHRFSCAKEKSQIPSRIEISKVFDVIVVKFDLKVPKSSSCLQSKNEHDFILIQRMYHRFSVVSGNRSMNMIIKKKRK